MPNTLPETEASIAVVDPEKIHADALIAKQLLIEILDLILTLPLDSVIWNALGTEEKMVQSRPMEPAALKIEDLLVMLGEIKRLKAEIRLQQQ